MSPYWWPRIESASHLCRTACSPSRCWDGDFQTSKRSPRAPLLQGYLGMCPGQVGRKGQDCSLCDVVALGIDWPVSLSVTSWSCTTVPERVACRCPLLHQIEKDCKFQKLPDAALVSFFRDCACKQPSKTGRTPRQHRRVDRWAQGRHGVDMKTSSSQGADGLSYLAHRVVPVIPVCTKTISYMP